MRGRKPKPRAIKMLQGTHRPDRDPPAPQPSSHTPPPPDWMPEAAKLEWTRLAADLAHLGTLTGLDTGLMTAWCCCWARRQEAEKKLLEMGAVVRGTSGGAIISPYFSISQRCLKELRAIANELGLSATSRARLHVAPPEVESEFEEFLRTGGIDDGRRNPRFDPLKKMLRDRHKREAAPSPEGDDHDQGKDPAA